MRKILCALAFMLAPSLAHAACAVTNLTVKDAAGSPVTALVPYADDGSGGSNCSPQIQIKQGGNVATVKAASTAAAAGDPSIVVNESPNSQTAVAIGATGDSANAATVVGQLKQIQANTAAAIPAGTNVVGFTSNDPCAQATKSGAVINLTASGQVIAGTSAKKTYICSLDLISATAQNIALVEGTGSTCATNIFGLAGGTTAATGWNLAANGGLTKGSGAGTVYSPSADTNGTAANVCILLSGAAQTSGQITYVQQ